jgi:hypothetical protein
MQIDFEDVKLVHMAEDRIFVITVMYLLVPQEQGIS